VDEPEEGGRLLCSSSVDKTKQTNPTNKRGRNHAQYEIPFTMLGNEELKAIYSMSRIAPLLLIFSNGIYESRSVEKKRITVWVSKNVLPLNRAKPLSMQGL
jgi:hypothetical protein